MFNRMLLYCTKSWSTWKKMKFGRSEIDIGKSWLYTLRPRSLIWALALGNLYLFFHKSFWISLLKGFLSWFPSEWFWGARLSLCVPRNRQVNPYGHKCPNAVNGHVPSRSPGFCARKTILRLNELQNSITVYITK
jgi:hypothetical protein